MFADTMTAILWYFNHMSKGRAMIFRYPTLDSNNTIIWYFNPNSKCGGESPISQKRSRKKNPSTFLNNSGNPERRNKR